MVHHPSSHTSVSVAHVILRATVAALTATILAHLAGFAVGQLMDALHTAPDANIGAGLVLFLLPTPLAPFLAWPLMGLVRLPRPTLTALVGTLPYLVLAVGALVLWAWSLSHVPTSSPGTLGILASANATALTVALGTTAVFTSRHARLDGTGA